MNGRTREPDTTSPGRDEVRVRRACPEDAGAIADLSGQLGYPSSREGIRRRLGPLLDSDVGVVIVAEPLDRPIVGWVHVVRRQLVMSDSFAQIEGLVVDEAWRGSGIGRLLVEAAERCAIEAGCRTIRVRSNVVRTGAHPFYKRIGFREVKRQVVYHKELEAP